MEPEPVWYDFLLRVLYLIKKPFCFIGVHIGKYRNINGHYWCPVCQKEIKR
jgi:hypothetical protein